MGGGKFVPGQPLAGPVRAGPVVSARLGPVTIGRVFAKGETGKVHALYRNADTQPVIDVATKAPKHDTKGKPIVVSCPGFGRGAKITEIPFTRAGADPQSQQTRCCTRGSRALVMVEVIKGERQFVDGTLTVTPMLRDRDGKIVSAPLVAASVTMKGDQIAKEFLVDVDLGKYPDLVGLFELSLAFDAKPTGAASFTFAPSTSRQFVLCTMDTPLDPSNDTATPAADTLSGTHRRMGKAMSALAPSSAEVEDILWRLYVAESNGTPPNFHNALGAEITHDGRTKLAGGLPFEFVEQWLMWTPNTGSPPWNRGACAGYVQLLKTMAATLGINVRRTLVLPVTNQLPPARQGDPKPPVIPTAALTLESPMIIAPGGLAVSASLQKATLVGWDKRSYQAMPALMEPDQKGEFFEACAVTPAGKYLPGGFSTARLQQTGVPGWTSGTSGAKPGGGFAKAQRGFDSAVDVLRWWSQTKTRSGFQRFMCWVAVVDNDMQACWDVDGKAYHPDDYELIRDTGKQLPAP